MEKIAKLYNFLYIYNMVINLYDLLKSISLSIDFTYPKLNNHHIQVANISYFLGKELGLKDKDVKKLLIASILHDIGCFSLKEKKDILNFHISEWNRHDIIGGKIIQDSKIFSEISPIITYHHRDYKDRKNIKVKDLDFLLSQIINVADRFEILSKRLKTNEAVKFIGKHVGTRFSPEVFSCLKNVVKKDIFNFELKYLGMRYFEDELSKYEEVLDNKDLLSLFSIFSKIIDFKSPFTCAHSAGISEISENLGIKLKLNRNDIYVLKCAGLVHDIGKIGIPSELINKHGKLTVNQYKKMKTHIYYSCQILKTVKSFSKIYDYAVHHHERLDGSGYPFGYKKESLSLGAKIMAVSDVYMALREDRPYRKGLTKEEVHKIMIKLVKKNKLCGDIVSILFENRIFDDIVEKNKSLRKKAFSNIML